MDVDEFIQEIERLESIYVKALEIEREIKFLRDDFNQMSPQADRLKQAIASDLSTVISNFYQDIGELQHWTAINANPTVLWAILNFYHNRDRLSQLKIKASALNQLYQGKPLYYGALKSKNKMKALFQVMPNPNIVWNKTAWLSYVVQEAPVEVLRDFLAMYAPKNLKFPLKIDVYDQEGYTPLMQAIVREESDKALALLNAGADGTLTVKRDDRDTTLDLWFKMNPPNDFEQLSPDDKDKATKLRVALCQQDVRLKNVDHGFSEKVVFARTTMIQDLKQLLKEPGDEGRETREAYLSELTLRLKRKSWLSRFLAIIGTVLYVLTLSATSWLVSNKKLYQQTATFFLDNKKPPELDHEFEPRSNKLCFYWGLIGRAKCTLSNPPNKKRESDLTPQI